MPETGLRASWSAEHSLSPRWDKKAPKTPWGCPLGMVLATAVFVAGIVVGSWWF